MAGKVGRLFLFVEYSFLSDRYKAGYNLKGTALSFPEGSTSVGSSRW